MSKRRTTVRSQIRALAHAGMPDKTITMLASLAGVIAFVYVVLVIVTVYFATWQTSLAATVRSTEGNLSQMESTYYSSIASLNATNPIAAGYVQPSEVKYAEAKAASGLSYARN